MMPRTLQCAFVLGVTCAGVMACGASGAKHAFPRAFGVIVNGADSVSARDGEGRLAPCSSDGCTPIPGATVSGLDFVGYPQGAPKRVPWLVEIVEPQMTHYVIRCAGRGSRIDIDAFVILPGGHTSTGMSVVGAADSAYEWAFDWQVLKGDSACCLSMSQVSRMLVKH